MKTQLICLMLIFSFLTVFGQSSKKSYEKEYEKLIVPGCTISGMKFTKGDTITIGQPANINERFSFIHRRIKFLNGIPELEKFRLSNEWTNRLVEINETYSTKEGNNEVCYAEFKIGKDFFGWIALENAIKTKEILKLNDTNL